MQKNIKPLTKIFLTLSIFILILTPVRILIAAENPISPRVELNTPIPGANGATEVVENLADYMKKIYNLGIAVAGISAMVMITVGGIIYLTSAYAGNVVKAQSGLSYIKSALLGLTIALLSYLIIYTIDPNLTHPSYVFNPDFGACSGGFGNIENEEQCQQQCTLGDYSSRIHYNSETKCCQCDTTCAGMYTYPDVPFNSCDAKCRSECPEGKTCRIDNLANDNCCKCFFSQFEDTSARCEGGTKIQNGLKCNEYCSSRGGSVSYDLSTQCCKCANQSPATPSVQQNCDDYCPGVCTQRGERYNQHGIEHDASGNCICSCY